MGVYRIVYHLFFSGSVYLIIFTTRKIAEYKKQIYDDID